jgi:hypothetical protein
MNNLGREAAYLRRRVFRTVFEVRAVADVDNDLCQRLIHWHEYTGVALNAAFVAKRFTERLPDANADVLHRVVIVDINIAARLYFQVKLAVLRKQVKHMIQEWHIRINLRFTRTINGKRKLNIRFVRLARHRSLAYSILRHKHSFFLSKLTACSNAVEALEALQLYHLAVKMGFIYESGVPSIEIAVLIGLIKPHLYVWPQFLFDSALFYRYYPNYMPVQMNKGHIVSYPSIKSFN